MLCLQVRVQHFFRSVYNDKRSPAKLERTTKFETAGILLETASDLVRANDSCFWIKHTSMSPAMGRGTVRMVRL